MVEILQEWIENSTIPTNQPPIPLESQSRLLEKKYIFKKFTIETTRYCPEEDKDVTNLTEEVLVCFKDIVVKYRPHLHMGDYWLHVQMVNGTPKFKFYHQLKYEYFNSTEDKRRTMVLAEHPHLSNGVPCLGSHQGDITTAFAEFNFVRFFSQMKLYLQSYYGRSTYHRGTEYKKRKLTYALHSFQEITDMFGPEYEDPQQMDQSGLAVDPDRWNFPKQMPAWGSLEVQGQEYRALLGAFRCFSTRNNLYKDYPFPYFDENGTYGGSFEYWQGDDSYSTYSKVMGYVAVCHIIGEMDLLTSVEFVRVFLLKLYLEFNGDINEEVMVELRKMSQKLNDTRYRNKWSINPRYEVILDNKRTEDSRLLRKELSESLGNSNSALFMDKLKYAGNKLGNFIILLRKKAPHKATMQGYINGGKPKEIDYLNYRQRYRALEQFVYKNALVKLEKDKRRFINELNKSDIIHIGDDVEQGSLFSSDL